MLCIQPLEPAATLPLPLPLPLPQPRRLSPLPRLESVPPPRAVVTQVKAVRNLATAELRLTTALRATPCTLPLEHVEIMCLLLLRLPGLRPRQRLLAL